MLDNTLSNDTTVQFILEALSQGKNRTNVVIVNCKVKVATQHTAYDISVNYLRVNLSTNPPEVLCMTIPSITSPATMMRGVSVEREPRIIKPTKPALPMTIISFPLHNNQQIKAQSAYKMPSTDSLRKFTPVCSRHSGRRR